MDGLTDEQQAVVELPVDAEAIVVAGPGTGKTYTLVRRVAELTTAHRLAAGNELLVLTFTNAVVDELRLRLGDHRDAAYVRPSTIDSFAGGSWLAPPERLHTAASTRRSPAPPRSSGTILKRLTSLASVT